MKSRSVDAGATILTVNAGSSSIKFALYDVGEGLTRSCDGKIERIGAEDTSFTLNDCMRNERHDFSLDSKDHRSAADALMERLGERMVSVRAVGHRVVHGMRRTEPALVTSELVDELCGIVPYDPDHLPREIELIEAFRKRYPELPQIVCFDTAFHRTLPRVARLLPIPRRYEALGIERYGFHGLSYEYLVGELARVAGTQASHGRVILAHLGSGASMAAVLDGKSVDTSMGFTPVGGFPMGTRPGDLDPGVAAYLMRAVKMTPQQFNDVINHESGLLGVSETSSDMRDLIEREATDGRAREAIELFCYQARKWIGAFAAALEGLDTLVFSGGIGENSSQIRARVCEGLNFLGLAIDAGRNESNAAVISAPASRVTVYVIPTNEEAMIAATVNRLLNR